jgi:hypothetical protein
MRVTKMMRILADPDPQHCREIALPPAHLNGIDVAAGVLETTGDENVTRQEPALEHASRHFILAHEAII